VCVCVCGTQWIASLQMMCKKIFLMFVASTGAAADGHVKKFVHTVATGKADCSGGAVGSESYNALDTCMMEYGNYAKKLTCNSTHIITSMYLKTVTPPCSGTPDQSTAAPLCNPNNGALTTCTTSAPFVSRMSGETAACASPYQETFLILDTCVKNSAKVSSKAACINTVLYTKKYGTADCTGAHATNTTTDPFYGRTGTTGLSHSCLGPVTYETGTAGEYSEYYTLKGSSHGCPVSGSSRTGSAKTSSSAALKALVVAPLGVLSTLVL